MKNRKTVVVAFLLVAAMMLGVGYATLTDTLVINGTADISVEDAQSAFNDDIYFSDAVANDLGNIAEIGTDVDMASFTASNLKGAGDKATFTFTIKNAGDLDADITPSLASNDHEANFNIYSDWRDGNNAIITKTLEAGETITYTVTVVLKNTPTAALTGSFHINLEAEAISNA